jgi:hypothetical protein
MVMETHRWFKFWVFWQDPHQPQIDVVALAPDLVLLDKTLRDQAVAILAGLD